MAVVGQLRVIQRQLWPYADLITSQDDILVSELSADARAAAVALFQSRGREQRPVKGRKDRPEPPRHKHHGARPVAAASVLVPPESQNARPDIQANFAEGDVYRQRKQEQLRENLSRRRLSRDLEALRKAEKDRDLAQEAVARAKEGDDSKLRQVKEKEFEKAAQRAQGAKIRDDPARIRKSMRKAGAKRPGAAGGFQRKRGYLN